MEWISLQDQMPDPQEHQRVLIFCRCHDFNGQQFFDVKAEDLHKELYEYDGDQPEECAYATHWMPLPFPCQHDWFIPTDNDGITLGTATCNICGKSINV